MQAAPPENLKNPRSHEALEPANQLGQAELPELGEQTACEARQGDQAEPAKLSRDEPSIAKPN